MTESNILVPQPMIQRKNILIMEFIGEDGLPSPELRQIRITQPATKFRQIIENVNILYTKAGLVHGDLSEYNILVKDSELVIIDVGQSVVIDHPMALELLTNDINNISNYFIRNYKIKVNPRKILDKILKSKENE
jgi:RIO kinase 1